MGTASHMPAPKWQLQMALDLLNGSTLNVPCIYAGGGQRLAFDLPYLAGVSYMIILSVCPATEPYVCLLSQANTPTSA